MKSLHPSYGSRAVLLENLAWRYAQAGDEDGFRRSMRRLRRLHAVGRLYLHAYEHEQRELRRAPRSAA